MLTDVFIREMASGASYVGLCCRIFGPRLWYHSLRGSHDRSYGTQESMHQRRSGTPWSVGMFADQERLCGIRPRKVRPPGAVDSIILRPPLLYRNLGIGLILVTSQR